jgi:exodeoxyribonuclease VII large subunit
LSCYDHLTLARAIANFPLPVITGIGHSTNETVSEMVACVNKITPTDVAHFILAGFNEQDLRLQSLAYVLRQNVASFLEDEKLNLSDFQSRISNFPMRVLSSEGMALQNRTRMLVFNIRHYLENHQHRLNDKENKVRLLDPENVLKRGYAIIRTSGRIPVDFEDVNEGDQLEIETYKLRIEAIVGDIVKKPLD